MEKITFKNVNNYWNNKKTFCVSAPGACTIKLYGFVIYEKQPNFTAS